jgi:hypothetical protein
MSMGGMLFFLFPFRWRSSTSREAHANVGVGISTRMSIQSCWRGICKRCLEKEAGLLEL